MSRPAARRVAPWMVGVSLLACTPDEQGSDVQATTAAPAASEAGEAAPTSDTPTPAAETDAASEAGEPAPADSEGPPLEAESAGEAVLDERAKEPEGYGLFTFPTPPPSDEQLTMHAAAGYEVVAVYAAPDAEAERLGFLRIGTRLRASAAIKKDDCSSGWHHLEGGGYACASKGLMVDSKPPFMSYEPTPPRKDNPSPYDWALINKWNAPQWWRVPNAEQYKATYEQRAIREAERLGEPLPGEEPAPAPKPKPKPAAGGEGAEGAEEAAAPAAGDPAALPAPEGEEAAAPEAAPEPPPAPAPEPDPAPEPSPEPEEEEEEEEPVNIPFSPAAPWLEKGYFVSLGEGVTEEGRSYWRTARGGVVEKKNAYGYEPKDFQGAELTEHMSFPVGFVMVKGGTKLMRLGKGDKLEATGQNLEKRTFLDLGEEVELGGRAYFTVIEHPEGETGDGAAPAEPSETLLVKAAVIRQPQLQPIPQGLQPYDRWIDVDISKQMLVAYEGARPVYVTLVSTGKKGTDEEPFETPTGRFRIRSKQLTSNMDGTTATDGNYAIQDVPWVMYFEGSYALHGAFWHRTFGSVRSHGCVNLGPSDARWLYFWTTPFVPDTWHGARSSDDNPGTTIVIRKSEEG